MNSPNWSVCMIPDEVERLEELARYDIVDSPAEKDFDDLVAMAAEICQVPIALVSIVEHERQWFKARVGLEATETPRDISFCQFAILGDDVMVVPDAMEDERFVNNPLVTGEPHIRFYAGVPLIARSGHKLGTLCIIDRTPRELSPERRRMLSLLARQVMAQIELRRSLRETETAIARQQDIVHEMAHRMKNSLTIVQSIVSQTLRRADSLESGRAAIEARLAALGRAQDALTNGDVGEVDVESLVRSALSPHGAITDAARFVLAGDKAEVGPRQALGLSLGLHELATNAAKYGSLSVPEGRVHIGWVVEDDRFHFTWREEGGPRPVAPDSRGFGSRLVDRIVPAYFEGRSTLSFPEGGVVYSLDGKAGETQKLAA